MRMNYMNAGVQKQKGKEFQNKLEAWSMRT